MLPSVDPVTTRFEWRVRRSSSTTVVTPNVWSRSVRQRASALGPLKSAAADLRVSSNSHS
jgi:hypothetical protein